MATTTHCKCDLCGQDGIIKGLDVDTRFVTEQTEGRFVKPYIQRVKLDFCQDCYDYYLASLPITGQGAQGYNSFKRTKEPT